MAIGAGKSVESVGVLAIVEMMESRQLLSAVASVQLFYNQSAFDGNDPSVNSADHMAIATDKRALRELEQASFANYSSYSRGINGLMIDIDQPNGTPTMDDFVFRAGNDQSDPFGWPMASPSGYAVWPGVGLNGSTRFVFTWHNALAIKGKWLQITVRPTARTGLLQWETFYYGSAPGDTGNSPASSRVDAIDELRIRANPRNLTRPAAITDPFDINRDRKVDGADQLVARANTTNFLTELKQIATPLTPVGDLAAERYSEAEVRLTWSDRSLIEDSYSIQVRQGNGVFSELQRVPANTTAALVTGLSAEASSDFQVVAMSMSSTVNLTAVQPLIVTAAASQSASTAGWWAVTVNGSLRRGEASFTGDGLATVPANKVVVRASSPEAAVSMAVQGAATIANTLVTPSETKTYSFPGSSAFRVGTIDSFAGVGGFDTATVKANFGATNETMVIMLEDLVEWQPADYDYDDFGWVVSATPIAFKPEALTFLPAQGAQNRFTVHSDGGSEYGPPEWVDANLDGNPEREWPTAYLRDSAMKVQMRFKVEGLPSGVSLPLDAIQVRGTSSAASITFYARNGDPNSNVTHDGSVLQITDEASTSFPDSIQCYDPMTIEWQISLDEQANWEPAGTTKNQVYVLLGAPTTRLYHTVVHLGSKNAAGRATADTAFAAIWSEFTDRSVKRVDGTQLTYYNDYRTSNTTTAQLLASGDGQCGAWASLLIDVLKAQGIDNGYSHTTLVPSNGASGLLVQSWGFTGAGTSGVAGYPYMNLVLRMSANPISDSRGAAGYNWVYAQVTDAIGAPGQGNANPASLFGNHQVVKIDGTYYDPSAGTSYTSLAQLENMVIAGYFKIFSTTGDESVIGLDLNGDGDAVDAGVPIWKFVLQQNLTGNQLKEG